METILTFLNIAGFIIGLGAVTVIDLHGFLGRKSQYWTVATIRTHKITKPLIWIGTILVLYVQIFSYINNILTLNEFITRIIITFILILNGLFLSFVVSPKLLQKEKEGKSQEILDSRLQNKIIISFVVSFTGWWGLVYLFTISILK